jgi:hypothetical protein
LLATRSGPRNPAPIVVCELELADFGRDVQNNTRDGVHIASLAGAWIAAVAGFGGMRDHGGRLTFAPRLPAALPRLARPAAAARRPTASRRERRRELSRRFDARRACGRRRSLAAPNTGSPGRTRQALGRDLPTERGRRAASRRRVIAHKSGRIAGAIANQRRQGHGVDVTADDQEHRRRLRAQRRASALPAAFNPGSVPHPDVDVGLEV